MIWLVLNSARIQVRIQHSFGTEKRAMDMGVNKLTKILKGELVGGD